MLKKTTEFTKITLNDLTKFFSIEDEAQKKDEPKKFETISVEVTTVDQVTTLLELLQNEDSPVQQLQLSLEFEEAEVQLTKDCISNLKKFLDTDTKLIALYVTHSYYKAKKTYCNELDLCQALYSNTTLRILSIKCVPPANYKFDSDKRNEVLKNAKIDVSRPFLFCLNPTSWENKISGDLHWTIKNINRQLPTILKSLEKKIAESLELKELNEAAVFLGAFENSCYNDEAFMKELASVRYNLGVILSAEDNLDLLHDLQAVDTAQGYPIDMMVKACPRLLNDDRWKSRLTHFEKQAEKTPLSRLDLHELDKIYHALIALLQAKILEQYQTTACTNYAIVNQRLAQYFQNQPRGLTEKARLKWIRDNYEEWFANMATAASYYLSGGTILQEDFRIVVANLANIESYARGESPKDGATLLSLEQQWLALQAKIKSNDGFNPIYLFTQMLVTISLLNNRLPVAPQEGYAMLVRITMILNASRDLVESDIIDRIIETINKVFTHYKLAKGQASTMELPLLKQGFNDLSRNVSVFQKVASYFCESMEGSVSEKFYNYMKLLKAFMGMNITQENINSFPFLIDYVVSALRYVNDIVLPQMASVYAEQTNPAEQNRNLRPNWREILLGIDLRKLCQMNADFNACDYLQEVRKDLRPIFVDQSNDQVKRLLSHGTFKLPSEARVSQGASMVPAKEKSAIPTPPSPGNS